VTAVLLLLLAASSTGIPADRFVPGVGPVTLMGGEGADVTPLGQGALALSFGLVRSPLHLDLSSGGLLSRPVRWQFGTDLAAEAGLWKQRVALAVGIPVVWWQAGDRLRNTGVDEAPLATTRAGDMRIRLKAALRNTHRVHIATQVQLTVPLGGQDNFAATDGVTVEPRLILDVHLQRWLLAFALGVRFGPDRELFQTHLGDELTWSAGVGVRAWERRWFALGLMAEAAGGVGGSPGSRPAEARGGVRLGLGPILVDAGAGAGLDGEVAAPAWRLFLIARALVGRAR
jgi:hypothetical protein